MYSVNKKTFVLSIILQKLFKKHNKNNLNFVLEGNLYLDYVVNHFK